MAHKTAFNVPVRVEVVNRITNYLTDFFIYAKPNHRLKVWEKLIELYFFIEVHQLAEKKRLRGYKRIPVSQERLEELWVNINSRDMFSFKFYIEDKEFNYSKLLIMLEKAGVIEINSSYSSGRFSKSYRIATDISSSETIILNLDLYDRVYKNNSRLSSGELQIHWPQYSKLIKTLFETTIDLEAAFADLDSKKDQIWNYRDGQALYLDDKTILEHKITAIMMTLGMHWFKPSTAGRIYTSITNLPKTLVPHILINGQKTVEIDCVNCQPLLLCRLIDSPDYQIDCEKGKFYEAIAEELKISRDEAKELSFSQIFFNNKWLDPDMYELLDRMYPGLPDQINNLKCKNNKEAQERDKCSMLWYRLQSIESEIFVESTCNKKDKIFNHSLLSPVLTRHDSWICPDDLVSEITYRLNRAFAKKNLKPKLKIKK